MYSRIIFLLVIVLFTSCQKQLKEARSVNGIWRSLGSGWILHIEDSTRYSFYDITSISCLPARAAALEEIQNALELHSDTLSLTKGVITYKFIRIPELPDLCQTTIPKERKLNPVYNFEVFAETISEHYAFIELNNVDWPILYEAQKAKLDVHTTDVELYSVLEETLEKLNDNHAYLEATDEVYAALEEQMSVEEATDEGKTLREYGDFEIAGMVAKHHLIEDMTKDSWLIQWGKLTDEIGFIQIKAMWLYADLDIPQTLIDDIGYVDAYVEIFHNMYEGNYIDKEVEGVRKIMEQVMADLEELNSMVIDIRFNGGGQDAVSFEILRRFNPSRQQVATQKLRYGNKFSPILPLYIESSANAYTKPVYVLTSPQTGSAAEAFAIATMSFNNVKRIGSHTSGAMSTALEKTLPNGWTFSISNEVYMDNHGKNYENAGIPVDYELKYPEDRQDFFRAVANDLEVDKQNILNAMKIDTPSSP